MNNALGIAGIIVLIVGLIIAGPLLILWSLNTLFPVLALEYTIWTWLAALILGGVFGPTVKVKR